MKRWIIVMGLAMFIVTFAVTANSQPLIIKVGHAGTRTHQAHIGAAKLAELLEKDSGGKMKIEIFPDAQLGGERDLAEGTRLGTLDMAMSSVATFWVPELNTIEMPFLFRDRGHAYKAIDGFLGDYLKGLAEKKGLKILAFWEIGFRCITNNRRPIETPQDMQGLKIRVPQSKVFLEMMKSVGAIGTPIAFPEVYSALQQGVVDGQENPIATIRSMNFFEVQKFLSMTHHVYTPSAVLISPKLWSSLTAEQKAMLQKNVNEATQYQRKTVAEKEADDLAFMKSKGIAVVEKPNVEAFRKAMSPVYSAMADLVPPAMVTKIREIK
jgi:tripartite ATP-independent transporter DctP family solute receptor